MDRKLLGILLQSGPARKFDVRYFVNKSIACLEDEDDSSEIDRRDTHLFETCFLNQSIIFKYSIFENDYSSKWKKPVRTLVYLPYDDNKPEDGGESFIFSRKNYEDFCEFKKKYKYEEFFASERDLDILTVLDSVPTFSPLILELAFQRASISIPDQFLDLSDDMRIKLKKLMKSRVRPLIVAAFGSDPRKVENAVDELTTKVFTLQNISDIMPFVCALRLPEDQAIDLMASWVGITYFEHEYSTVQMELQGVASFLNSRPHENLHFDRDSRQEVFRNTEFIRGRLRADWARIRTLSGEYKAMYEGLIFHGNIMGFREFLLRCKTSYWELGDILGRLEQVAIAWKAFDESQGLEITSGALIEFLILLRNLNTVTPANTVIGNAQVSEDSGFEALAAELF